ncbi:MAG: TIGR01212 family radical SAM protein [Syntrophomonadaceae bacterium]|nr:TIGR01212 family radical SAM protein [Syntrophomonadaceae bacterium]
MANHLWDGKRYNSLNYQMRRKFGQKVFKIALDGGFTCPNRDGTYSQLGCLFCSARGAGDFAGDRNSSIQEQFHQLKKVMHKKWGTGKYIAYFQAFSNTYAPADKLRKIYQSALQQEGVVGLAVATRPDCLPPEVMDLLGEINQHVYLWVELGLQSIHLKTSRLLNLHYTFENFAVALKHLHERRIESCAHIILGLPGENREDMLATGRKVASLPIKGIKIHALHLMKNTPLVKLYQDDSFDFLTREQYVNLVVDILEMLSPEVVVHRLTGDSPRELLLEPQWTLNKWEVLNLIDKVLIERDSWQGKFYSKE